MHGFATRSLPRARRPPPPPGRDPRRRPARPRPPRPVRLHPSLRRLVGAAALAQGRLLAALRALRRRLPLRLPALGRCAARTGSRTSASGASSPGSCATRRVRPARARRLESGRGQRKFLRFSSVHRPMAFVETIRQLWQRKLLVGLVARARGRRRDLLRLPRQHQPARPAKSARSASPPPPARSSSTRPTRPWSPGAELGTFEALSTRAKIYGQYLASLDRPRRRSPSGPASRRSTISTSGPFSSATGQTTYASQPSEERAGELLQEGAANRLVFTAQEGVPILTVDAQAATSEHARSPSPAPPSRP